MICTIGTLLGAFRVKEAAVAITKAVIMFGGALAVRKMQRHFKPLLTASYSGCDPLKVVAPSLKCCHRNGIFPGGDDAPKNAKDVPRKRETERQRQESPPVAG